MAGSVNVQITGVGGANQGGVYVAPYYLSINHQPTFAVMCDDFGHEVTIGESWSGHISTFADLSNTRFGSADTQQFCTVGIVYAFDDQLERLHLWRGNVVFRCACLVCRGRRKDVQFFRF